MAFNPNAPQQEFTRELIPEGTYAARCVRVIELGKHLSGFQTPDGEPEKPKDKAVIVLSLPEVLMEYGGEQKQAFISRPFGITMSSFETSNMKEYTRALDPDGETQSIGDFINRTCQVTVQHKPNKEGTMYANIVSVAPLLKGFEVPELDTVPFWYEWDNPQIEYWNQVPEFQQNLIRSAVNFHGSPTQKMLEGGNGTEGSDPAEDLPF